MSKTKELVVGFCDAVLDLAEARGAVILLLLWLAFMIGGCCSVWSWAYKNHKAQQDEVTRILSE